MIKQAIASYLKTHNQSTFVPQAILFDMDGVLYDSMQFHARAWKEIADHYGLPATCEDFYMWEGRTGASTIDILFQRRWRRKATEEEKKNIYAQKTALFAQYNDGTPMNGAREVLQKVQAYHLQTLIVTGSAQKTLIDKLDKTYPDIFQRERMVTGEDVQHGKPNPEPYCMGLQKAGISASEAIVIENAPLGIASAVAAHIFTIAVNTGPLSDKILLDAGANLLYPDMKSLADDWDRLMTAAGINAEK